MVTRSAKKRAATALLSELPPDLVKLIATFVTEPHDVAALCAAHPRLGLAALRALDDWRRPLVAVAWRLLTTPGFAVDEPLLRKYAASDLFEEEGCIWLA